MDSIEKQVDGIIGLIAGSHRGNLKKAPDGYMNAHMLAFESDNPAEEINARIIALFRKKAINLIRNYPDKAPRGLIMLSEKFPFAVDGGGNGVWHIDPQYVPELELEPLHSHIERHKSITAKQMVEKHGFVEKAVTNMCLTIQREVTGNARRRGLDDKQAAAEAATYVYKALTNSNRGEGKNRDIWYITPKGEEEILERLKPKATAEILQLTDLEAELGCNNAAMSALSRQLTELLQLGYNAKGLDEDASNAEMTKCIFKKKGTNGVHAASWFLTQSGAEALKLLNSNRSVSEGHRTMREVYREVDATYSTVTIYCERLFTALFVSNIVNGNNPVEAISKAQEYVYKAKPDPDKVASWVVTDKGVELLKNRESWVFNEISPQAYLRAGIAAQGGVVGRG